jgi:hypothetical protein
MIIVIVISLMQRGCDKYLKVISVINGDYLNII